MTAMENLENDCRVTWLLPVKNGMPYLPETLASLVAQTYRNFEVLAWDNGSTDDTVEELRKWIPSRLPGSIITDRPLGLGASLAEMVKEATTELCARIDADDISLPDRLEKQVAFLNTHPDIALVGTQFVHMDASGQTHGLAHEHPVEHTDIIIKLIENSSIAHPSVLFRRAAVLQCGNYQDVGSVNVEDYDLWMRLAVRHRLANLSEPLLLYRIHPKSVTVISMAENKLRGAVDIRCGEHAPALFGCSADEIKHLRTGIHPHPMRLLRQIAQFRAQRENIPIERILTSPAFLQTAQLLIRPDDYFSRLKLACLHQSKYFLLNEAAQVVKAITKKTLKRTFFYRIHLKRQLERAKN